MTTTLKTQDLTIGYQDSRSPQKVIAKHLNLEIKPGQFICLIGVNGAGKSTLMRTLCGLQSPLSGNIFLNETPLSEVSAATLSKTLGVVLTEKITTGHLTVASLVALGRHPHTGWFGKLSSQDEQLIDEALEQTQLQKLRHQHVGSLSDGQRQKVMIARVLAQQTPLILLDEPTAFLDLVQRVEIAMLLRKIAHEQGHGVLLSTHDLELALRMADQVWLFDANQQVHVGTPEDLILSNAFQNIFESPHLHFDQESGAFQIQKSPSSSIVLHGEGTSVFWTQRALERCGFAVLQTETPSFPLVTVTSENNQPAWHVTTGASSQVATNIAEMLSLLEV